MIRIVQATFLELEDVALLFDKYRQFYKKESALGDCRQFIKERMIHQESVIYIAFNEGRGVGFVQLYPIFSSVSLKKLWLLNDLFVEVEERGKAVGYELLKKAAELAKQSEAKGLMLQTAADNDRAKRLYEKFGFEKDVTFEVYDYAVK